MSEVSNKKNWPFGDSFSLNINWPFIPFIHMCFKACKIACQQEYPDPLCSMLEFELILSQWLYLKKKKKKNMKFGDTDFYYYIREEIFRN